MRTGPGTIYPEVYKVSVVKSGAKLLDLIGF